MAGLYEFPGEYAMRFDGIAPGEWCGNFTSWSYSQGSRTATVQKARLTKSGLAGTRAEEWLNGVQPRTLVIEKLSRAGLAVACWRVRNARALRLSGRTARSNQIAIEKVEIVYEHIERIR